MEIEIVFRDEWLCVVDKPAGWLVHPAGEPVEGDVVAMKVLRDQIGERVFSIHRLDRPTSGVLLFGIDREVSKRLHGDLADGGFEKVYRAVVNGVPGEVEWVCELPLSKGEGAPMREARTEFRLVRSWECGGEVFSEVEAVPVTGRTHQIRRHLLAGGFPIVGDYRYGGIDWCDRLGGVLGTGTRMLLRAVRLEFMHPVTGERLVAEVAGFDL